MVAHERYDEAALAEGLWMGRADEAVRSGRAIAGVWGVLGLMFLFAPILAGLAVVLVVKFNDAPIDDPVRFVTVLFVVGGWSAVAGLASFSIGRALEMSAIRTQLALEAAFARDAVADEAVIDRYRDRS